jgi:glucose-1-phosphate cytidylyltransferase
MKVVILCGGKGERLREETEFKPKPLIEIGSMPILWHIMKIYSHYGYIDFILLLGYKGHLIKEFFLNFEYMINDFTLNLRASRDKVKFHKNEGLEDWNITFVDTGENTNTGGRIARIKHLIKEDNFFLTYGDGLSDINIKELYNFHVEKKKILTITGINPTSNFGIIEVNRGLATSFKEKPKMDGVINGGFFVCNKKIFNFLSDSKNCVFEEEPMRELAKKNHVAVYHHQDFWAAMDTYKQARILNDVWNSDNVPWKIWK